MCFMSGRVHHSSSGYLSIKAVCRRLFESEEKVVDLINSGVLPLVVVNKQTVRVPEEADENYRQCRSAMRPPLRLVEQE